MNYEELFEDGHDRSFYVVATSPKGTFFPAFSWFVRYAESFYWLLKTKKWKLQPYSHVLVLFKNNRHGNIFCFQSSGAQVNLRSIRFVKKKTKPHLVWRLPNDIDRFEAVKWAFNNIDKPYPPEQILGTLYVKWMEAVRNKIVVNPWANGDVAMYCIELLLRMVIAGKSEHYLRTVNPENLITSDTPKIMDEIGAELVYDSSRSSPPK